MQTINQIIDFFANSWQGLLYGLLGGVVLAIILLAIFKGGIPKFILVAVAILGVALGGIIDYKFFNKKEDTGKVNIHSPEEIENILSSTIIDGWQNTNGGFTFEQILSAQVDNECPAYADQIITLNCQDYGDYVCFYFKNNNTYKNAVFLKTENGLIYDGLLNVTGEFEVKNYILWKTVNIDKWSWYKEEDTAPTYYEKSKNLNTYDDLVSLSSQNPTYIVSRNWPIKDYFKCEAEALRQGAKLAGTNITDNFIKFGDVELVSEKEDASKAINTFYNYLYNQVKTIGYGNRKLVDATGLLCLPIPEDLRENYPVSESFKEQYPDVDYYGVYRCNIAVDLGFEKGNKDLASTTKTEEYLEANKDKESVKVETVEVKEQLSKISLKFVDIGESDLTQLDLSKYPVKVTFSSNELDKTKTVVIDTLSKLQNDNILLLNKNVEWKYVIESNAVVFDTFMGTIRPSEDYSSFSLNYYYINNYVLASVGLNPVGTIDKTKINLDTYPVKIQLKNDKHTYTFLFDSNDALDKYKSQNVELGEYTYTILSEQLEFASATGTLEITNTDRTILFNYILSDVNALDIYVSYSGSIKPSTDIVMLGFKPTEALDTIYEKFGSNYKIEMLAYDSDEKLVYNWSVNYSITDNTTLDVLYNNGLNYNQTYLIQFRFTSASSDDVLLSRTQTIQFVEGQKYIIMLKVI